MLTLGLDPSTTHIGAALIHPDGQPVACWSLPIRGRDWPHKLLHGAARTAISTTLMVADGHARQLAADVSCVWIEDTRTGGGRNSRQTTWAQGGITALLIDACMRRWPHTRGAVTLITPSEWRPIIGIPGNAAVTKTDVVQAAGRFLWDVPRLPNHVWDHDAADAALIATAATITTGGLRLTPEPCECDGAGMCWACVNEAA